MCFYPFSGKICRFTYLTLSLLLAQVVSLKAQTASISEEEVMIKTYDYSTPNRLPSLAFNPKIYPYHQYTGYSNEGEDKEWKVITLENEYIKVQLLPQAGGKIWGAIEKASGEEFIYRNEVMKFRNIAMRGPWTSGGIEFNFGIIGHAPSTASAVDYHIEEHEDGSVSCTVGSIDLPSRTQWRVKIILPADKAYFKTETLWYNPTPEHQAYYNWMTAAALASSDLELFYPGNAYLGHSGDVHPWPIDTEGRNLSLYQENNFGSNKSYHIVGQYHDFFGGYWHNKDFGFGHWSLHNEMPGQKLWIWALSRSGGIWEDLLTDTDGQYIEFQAGRLLNQFAPAASNNPISEVDFGPYVSDKWEELWFPVKEIGGISEVSPSGAVHLRQNNGKLKLGFNAFRHVNDSLKLLVDDEPVYQHLITLQPTEVYQHELSLKEGYKKLKINLGDELIYSTEVEEAQKLKRPFESSDLPQPTEAMRLLAEGQEMVKNRNYVSAKEKLEAALKKEPALMAARLSLAKIYYKYALYEQALEQVNFVLKADTYDFDANYLAGIIYQKLGDQFNALETLGWAARSMEYRSAAYTQMAEIYLQVEDWSLAKHYAQLALDYNTYNINALQALAVAYRKSEQTNEAEKVISRILDLDPLNHFAKFEQYLLHTTNENLQIFKAGIRSEFPEQSYLETASTYLKMQREEEAIAILQEGPAQALISIWLAYLHREDEIQSSKFLESAISQEATMVAPYRPESLIALKWAAGQQPHWKLNYYLALNYWAKNQKEKSAELFRAVGEQAGFAPFYLSRAVLLHELEGVDQENDLRKAIAQNDKLWNSWHQLFQYLNQGEQHKKALAIAKQAYRKFPDNYVIGMDYAQALLNTEQYTASTKLLAQLNVLPYEGASEGRAIYEKAHLYVALQQVEKKRYTQAIEAVEASLLWPENLGVGKPYQPNNTKQYLLLSHLYHKVGKPEKSKEALQRLIRDLEGQDINPNINSILVLEALHRAGEQNKLDEVLRKLQSATTPHAQWVLGVWENNTNAQSKAEAEMKEGDYQLQKDIMQVLRK